MFKNIERSLADLLGKEYADKVASAAGKTQAAKIDEITLALNKKVAFYPESYVKRIDSLTDMIGQKVADPLLQKNIGATTKAFESATNIDAAPLSGIGALRLSEDGRVYLAAKSEHYHLSLGHSFPGYKLVDVARMAGIPNATHNNTRGFITRTLEKQLVRDVNQPDVHDVERLNRILNCRDSKVLNRVINLETGSLADEAGIKMMLSRFYKLDASFPQPKYSGKIPVFFVMADYEDRCEANYHGTTVLAQMMRDMWPEIYQKMEQAGVLKVVSVKINDIEDFQQKIAQFNEGMYKTAGFLHEIVLMNYGGIKLDEKYLQAAYELCGRFDTPTLVDEIQSCMWYKSMFLFKLYGLNPDFVVIGKGFPGGEYAASKIITTFEMDSLNQFGALVTNGQEELASLSYLITMEFARENQDEIARLGSFFEEKLSDLKARYASMITRIEGKGHLAAIHFETVDQAVKVAQMLNEQCIDASSQTYKANCPPAVLLKPPVIATEKQLTIICNGIETVLRSFSNI